MRSRPPPARSRRLGDASSNRWSAPAFVRVTGVEFGLVAGADRVRAQLAVQGRRLSGSAWGAPKWRRAVHARAPPPSTHPRTDRQPCRFPSLPRDPLQAETLVGVMSERALEALIASKGKFNMATNWCGARRGGWVGGWVGGGGGGGGRDEGGDEQGGERAGEGRKVERRAAS